MNLWESILVLFGIRPRTGGRYYELDDGLHTALKDLAAQEQRPVEEVQGDLLSRALAQQYKHGELWERWQSLSPREQQVAALACLGYTNRQIGARLGVSTETVKSHMNNLLRKFNLHSKTELRMALGEWDFSEWG